MIDKLNKKVVLVFFSVIFGLTIQQFLLFKGNIAVIIHAIEIFDYNKLQYDWIANQTDHIPLFTFFNYFLIKFFSINVIYVLHFILLCLCAYFLFSICENVYPQLSKINFKLIWFTIFIIIFHENSFFTGLAGQRLIDQGYQPASYGVLFLLGIYFFLLDKTFLSILFICLAASFHPTYVIHSGFLILGFFLYYLTEKKFSNIYKILIFYSLLITPITLYIYINFFNIDNDIAVLGRQILMKRIPHHADIHYWFSYKDVISIIIYLLALFLMRNKKKILIPLSIFGFCSILLSIIQFFLDLDSLALIFPWRSSVFLVPISSMIIVSFFITLFKIDFRNKKLILVLTLLIVSLFFFIKSFFLKNLNSEFKNNIILSNQIKKHYSSINSILAPIDMESLRLNTGLPIFINRKHHPFKLDEVVIWNSRLNLAKNFYTAKNFNEQKIALDKIYEIEEISHILFKSDQLYPDCPNLINNKKFVLVQIINCY